MAYAAAEYLRQLVEQEFIQFFCRTLEFKESKFREFHLNVNEVLDKLMAPESISPLSFPAGIKDYWDDLEAKTVAVDQIVCSAALFNKVMLNDRSIFNRLQHVTDQLDEVSSRIDNLLEYHDLVPSLSCQSPEILALESRREFANRLISLTREFQEVISLLYAMALEGVNLLDILDSLLLKLRNARDDSTGNEMKFILVEAGEKIEDLLSQYPFLNIGNISTEALMVVKSVIGDLKEATNRFESHTIKDLSLNCKEPESSLGSLLQRPQQWLHKWQQLFYIHSESEEDYSLKSSRLVSSPEPKLLPIQGNEIQEHPSELLSRNEGSSQSSTKLKLEDILVGLDDDIINIVDELTRPPAMLSMVTIAGMGGIGKTTLARKVICHPRVVYRFHYMAWLNGISVIGEALSCLLLSIKMDSDEIQEPNTEEHRNVSSNETHSQSTEDKGQSLWRFLRGKRYLIVIDSFVDFYWKDMERYLPDDNLGSRILVTSRSMTFDAYLPRHPPHCMRLLDDNQSWEMLKTLVIADGSCPSELVDIGTAIAKKCGGLRLTVVVIAGILKYLPRSYISWKNLMDNIESIIYDNPEPCLDILGMSYNYLPPHLKSCFLFMGSFPINHQFHVDKLLQLWLADGLLDSKSSNVTEECLEDLICRCFVLVGQRSFDGKIKTCSIHELLHQLCLRKANEEGFKHHHFITNFKVAADLELHSHYHLRSFMLLTPDLDVSLDTLVLFFLRNKRLRVLDMYFLPWDTFPKEILCLVNLRYLALNVTYVVDARLSDFWKLQTLVVYGPWIPMVGRQSGYIPTMLLDIWKMPWLRNVSIRLPTCFGYSTSCPRRLQDGSPNLITSNLQTLSTITFSSCTKDVLSLVPKLNELGVYETKADYEKGEFRMCFQNLGSMTGIETLKCIFYKEGKGLGYGPARNLVLDQLPLYLKKLTLCGSCLSWDKLEVLAILTKLETLKLRNHAFRGQVWKLKEVVFGRLKQLLIDKTDLESWEEEGADNFPRLEHLELRSCRLLQMIPFHAFSSLEQIALHNCSQSAEDSAIVFHEQYGSLKVVVRNMRTVVDKGTGLSIALYEDIVGR